jgi:hypothetical protein
MKVIGSYSKPDEAHLAASVLEGNGIKAYVRDTNSATWIPIAVGGARVEVSDEDAEKAMEVLNLSESEGQ